MWELPLHDVTSVYTVGRHHGDDGKCGEERRPENEVDDATNGRQTYAYDLFLVSSASGMVRFVETPILRAWLAILVLVDLNRFGIRVSVGVAVKRCVCTLKQTIQKLID